MVATKRTYAVAKTIMLPMMDDMPMPLKNNAADGVVARIMEEEEDLIEINLVVWDEGLAVGVEVETLMTIVEEGRGITEAGAEEEVVADGETITIGGMIGGVGEKTTGATIVVGMIDTTTAVTAVEEGGDVAAAPTDAGNPPRAESISIPTRRNERGSKSDVGSVADANLCSTWSPPRSSLPRMRPARRWSRVTRACDLPRGLPVPMLG